MSLTFYTKFPQIEKAGFNLKEYFRNYINSNVIISASSKSTNYPLHPGGPLTIKYVFTGEEYYICNKRKYRVSNGNFLVFNGGQEYESYIESENETESFSVFFKPDYSREVLSSLIKTNNDNLDSPFYTNNPKESINFIEKLYKCDNIIVPLLTRLRNAVRMNNLSPQYIYEHLYFLLEGLIKVNTILNSEIEKVESVKTSTRLELYRRLSIAKDYIESCYNEKIKLSDLASAACMCEFHLLREFKKYYCLTPYQYLLETRLKSAKYLLEETEKSVTEISSEIGFEYLSSFSAAFFKRYKISPVYFRNRLKKAI